MRHWVSAVHWIFLASQEEIPVTNYFRRVPTQSKQIRFTSKEEFTADYMIKEEIYIRGQNLPIKS